MSFFDQTLSAIADSVCPFRLVLDRSVSLADRTKTAVLCISWVQNRPKVCVINMCSLRLTDLKTE